MIVPPYALFVLTKIDTEELDARLTRAWKGNFENGWNLWIATKNYDDAPKVREDRVVPDGSQPPTARSFESPWIGSTIQECAKWLREAPPNVAIHPAYFTVIDIYSKEEDTVLVCHWFESGSSIDVEYFPQSTDVIALEMYTNNGYKYEEKAGGYQARRMRDGRPDRSKGGPYF